MTGYAAVPLRILLVEDNPGDAELIAELLASGPLTRDQIVHVETLAAALARLAAGGADVVLLDLNLPDGQGVECVEAVRRAAGELPIVVLTGTDDDAVALRCIAAGAQDYIAKQTMTGQGLRRAIAYAVTRAAEAEERRRADALQQRLAAIVESSSDAIVSSTLDGVITSWNRGAEQIFGYTAAEAVGRPSREIMRLPDAAAEEEHAQRLALLQGDGPPLASEVERLRKDGRPVVLSVIGFGLRDEAGRVVALAAICRDVTEARRQDAELRHKNEELVRRDQQMRALAGRLTAIREEERARISRAIHDELGQLLTGIKMDLRWISRRLPPDGATAPAAARVTEAERLVDGTLATVQRIALELRPSVLDALGLSAAIRDEARRFQARAGVAAEVDVSGPIDTDPEAATALFRICQELLTNVARHARASRVHVLLTGDAAGWTLRVEDDGIGLAGGEEGDEAERRTSLGLLGMRERAAALGGTFALEPGLERGTMATVRVPRGPRA